MVPPAVAGRWRLVGLGCAVCVLFALPINRDIGSMEMDGNAAIHYNLGNAYAKRGERQQALAEFAASVEKDPQYWQAWLNLGSVKGTLGDVRGAGEIFSRLSLEAPDQIEPWLNLAHVRIMQRDLRGAFAAYEAVLAINPKLLPAYVEMISLYGQMEDLAQAAQVLKRAVDNVPEERVRLRQLYDKIQMRVLSKK